MKLLRSHHFLNKKILINVVLIVIVFILMFMPKIYASDTSATDQNLLRILQEELASYGINSTEKAQELCNAINSTEGVESLRINDRFIQIDLAEGYTIEDARESLRESLANIIVIDENSSNTIGTALFHFRLVDSNGQASGAQQISSETTGATAGDNSSSVNAEADGSGSGLTLGTIVDGIAGILIYIPKLVLMIIGALLLRIIGFAINGIDGLVNGIPLDQILFNKIELLKVNFFSSVDPNDANAQIIESIRENIAVWYVAIRNLAAVILAVMVLYVGIRMAISSVAEEKAKYKRMLTDWVVSLVLLFVLHYIMILIININDAIVSVLAAANENGKGAPTSIMDDLWVKSLTTVSFTEQIGYVALYFMLAIMIFVFFATYVKRMITIAFLIMIAPIITITYSLDRMGDGKSQALNTWFKNFVYNILLQPFQCIIYLALVKTAIDSISANNLSSVVIAIIMVFFMYEAEDIIKEIFHFEGKSVANTIAQAALVTSAIGLVSKAASGAKAVRGYAKSTPSQNNTTTPTQTGIQKPGAEPPGQQESGAGQPGGQQEPKTQQPEPQPEPQNNVEKDATGYSRQSGGARGAVLGIAKKAGKAAIKGAIKLPFAVAFGAMGLGTGNLSTGITAFQAGSGLTEGFLASREEKANLHNFAKDYNNIAQEYTSRGYDNNQIREHTKDLLNGDVSAKDWEKDYYDSIVKEMDRYIAQGLSADDAITQVEQNVAGIQGGYLGEATVEQRFKGKISDAVKNRRRHNYGSANVNQNSGDPNNQNGGNPNNQN